MTMRLRLLAPALAVALSGAFLTTPAAHAATIDKTIGYDCDSSLGGGSSDVRILTTMPAKIHKGDTVSSRTVTFEIQIPDALVEELRDNSVDAVSAVGEDEDGKPTVFFKVGDLRKPVKNLVVPETPVPAEGGMTIIGTGTTASFTLKTTGTYAVKVTAGFQAIATAHGTIIGDVDAPISCTVADGESKKLGEIKVVR